MAAPVPPSPSSLTARTTAIITAIWTGIMGFAFASSYLMPDQLFMLLVIALTLGAALTALTLYFTFRLAQVVGGGRPGFEVSINGEDP